MQVESRMSQTGANADQWVPATPGTEGVLALGLAHVIMAAKLRPAARGRAGALIDGWSAGLTDYAPEQVEKITGVAAARVERLAREFAELTSVGRDRRRRAAGAHQRPVHRARRERAQCARSAASSSRAACSSRRRSIWRRREGLPARSRARRSTSSRPASSAASTPQVLLLDGANPVFTRTDGWKVREALEKVPFIVELRQLPRRDQRAGGPDPAGPLVPRVVGRGACPSRDR